MLCRRKQRSKSRKFNDLFRPPIHRPASSSLSFFPPPRRKGDRLLFRLAQKQPVPFFAEAVETAGPVNFFKALAWVALALAAAVGLSPAAHAYEGALHREEVDGGIHTPVLTEAPTLLKFVEARYPPDAQKEGKAGEVKLAV